MSIPKDCVLVKKADVDKIADKLMYILHELKHGLIEEELYNMLSKDFPNWREVEFFNGQNAFDFLFNTVLKNESK